MIKHLYKISYNLNGGKGVIEDTDILITPFIPKREKYDFLGWSESENAIEPEYLPNEIYKKNRDAVLYAVWSLTPVIKYDLKKYDDTYICNVKYENLTTRCKVFFVVYKESEIVQFEEHNYIENTEKFIIYDDFDSITIIIVDSTNKITPLSVLKKIYK